ncbi:MAG: hypothetical protein IJA70_03420 [Oscillospiraceae bacterium]|nr:hypothetical protein [Oscillospiraceae bacterium]
MWNLIIEWLYNNAAAIFISAFASWIISKIYFDKANRAGVLTTIIFPIVKILDSKYYSREKYEKLFDINSSYLVKYLYKNERNKLLALLSSYRTVCKYTKEAANTDCVMSYYIYKLEKNGINPKPCVETDDSGNPLYCDFPPDYNCLKDYVYNIISSYEFVESPIDCSKKIAQELKNYTKQYYTNIEIPYFDDYSIIKVIELSNITKEWDNKFLLADKCKSDFLELSICKKAKKIMQESSER